MRACGDAANARPRASRSDSGDVDESRGGEGKWRPEAPKDFYGNGLNYIPIYCHARLQCRDTVEVLAYDLQVPVKE